MLLYALFDLKKKITSINKRLLEKESKASGLESKLKSQAREIAQKSQTLADLQTKMAELGDYADLKSKLEEAENQAVSTKDALSTESANGMSKTELNKMKTELNAERAEIKRLEEKISMYERLMGEADGVVEGQTSLIREFVENQRYIAEMANKLNIPDRETKYYGLEQFKAKIEPLLEQSKTATAKYLELVDKDTSKMTPVEKALHDQELSKENDNMDRIWKELGIWQDAERASGAYMELQSNRIKDFFDKYTSVTEKAYNEVKGDIEKLKQPNEKGRTFSQLKTMSFMPQEFFTVIGISGDKTEEIKPTAKEETEWIRMKKDLSDMPKKFKTRSVASQLAGEMVDKIPLDTLKDRELFALFHKLKDTEFSQESKKNWFRDLKDRVMDRAGELESDILENQVLKDKNNIFKSIERKVSVAPPAMARRVGGNKIDMSKFQGLLGKVGQK
jgi:hypothetical protein